MEQIEDIAGVVKNYFENIFKASICDRMGESLDAVPHKVPEDMMQILSSNFSADEIKAALF